MDGECPLCRQSQRWAEARDRHDRLRFRDFREAPDEELPLPRGEMEKALRVRRPDGRLVGGFAGWRALMAALPRWRWMARVAGLPPLRWIGPPLYRFISSRRHALPIPMPDE